MAIYDEFPDTDYFLFSGSAVDRLNFPTNFKGYVEFTIPLPSSGSLEDVLLPLSINSLPIDFKELIKTNGADIRLYREDGSQLPRDIIHCTGSGADLTGLLMFRYSDTITSNSKVRIYAGKPSLTEPDASSTYGQYNVYDSNVRGFWPYGLGNDRTNYVNHLTLNGSPSVGGVAGPIAGSLATDLNGIDQYGTTTISVPSGRPLTMFGTVDFVDHSGDYTILSMSNGAGPYVRLFHIDSNDRLRFTHNGNFNRTAASTNIPTLNGWVNAAGAEVSQFARYVYIDGVNEGNNTSTLTPSAYNHIGVGVILNGSSVLTDFFKGKLAFTRMDTTFRGNNYVKYWHDALADSDQSSFYGTFTYIEIVKGLTFSGTTNNFIILSKVGSGGLRLNSTVTPRAIYRVIATAGIRNGGTAAVQFIDSANDVYSETGSGGIRLSGLGATVKTFDEIGLGGLVFYSFGLNTRQKRMAIINLGLPWSNNVEANNFDITVRTINTNTYDIFNHTSIITSQPQVTFEVNGNDGLILEGTISDNLIIKESHLDGVGGIIITDTIGLLGGLNSKQKRRSIVNLGLPWNNNVEPNNFDKSVRRAVANCYDIGDALNFANVYTVLIGRSTGGIKLRGQFFTPDRFIIKKPIRQDKSSGACFETGIPISKATILSVLPPKIKAHLLSMPSSQWAVNSFDRTKRTACITIYNGKRTVVLSAFVPEEVY